MIDLIERLEKATGPDAELDYAIGELLYMQGRKPWECFNYGKEGPAIKFTASIDAALTLLPGEDFHWKAGYSKHVRHNAEVRDLMHPDKGVFIGEHDHSRAIALCIAALKAWVHSSGKETS